METGKIKFYDTAKGFGFIKDQNSEAEYFFHYTGLKSLSICKDDRVKFEVIESHNKPNTYQAVKVEKI